MKHLSPVLASAAHERKDRVFKPAFLSIFAWTGGGVVVLLSLLWIALWWSDPMIPLSAWVAQMLPLLIAGVVAEIPLTLWIVHRLRVEVGADAISSTTYGSNRHSLTWAEIESVETVKMGRFVHLKVLSFRTDRSPLYIPRHIADDESFREKVVRTAAPTNPLRQALESRAGNAVRAKASR